MRESRRPPLFQENVVPLLEGTGTTLHFCAPLTPLYTRKFNFEGIAATLPQIRLTAWQTGGFLLWQQFGRWQQTDFLIVPPCATNTPIISVFWLLSTLENIVFYRRKHCFQQAKTLFSSNGKTAFVWRQCLFLGIKQAQKTKQFWPKISQKRRFSDFAATNHLAATTSNLLITKYITPAVAAW